MTERPLPSSYGRFVIAEALGAGGMGTVFRATDSSLGRPVALKVMSDRLANDPEFRERFRREATVLGRLDSPHVITIYDHGEQDGRLWIATQLVTGGDLGELLRKRGPMPLPMAARVGAQVAEALAATHAVGVLHRDVKPSNVLLRDPDADKLHAYLCDFGIAQSGEDGLTVGGVAGTWSYLSPERGRGLPATPTSDIYAVGCLLWECLTGAPPYRGSQAEVAVGHRTGPIPQLPAASPLHRGVNQVLRGCLAKDPQERYPSTRELRADLSALERGEPDALYTERAAARPATSRQPRRLWLALGAGALVAVLVAVTGGVIWANRDGEGSDPDGSASSPGPTKPAVRGDVTGDGLGDLTLSDWDTEDRTASLLASDGSRFDEPTDRFEAAYGVRQGDVDGNGTNELVSYDVSGGTVEITALESEPDSRSVELDRGDLNPDAYTLVLADVSGDGRDDLLLTTDPGSSGGDLEIGVALSTGTGFEKVQSVYSGKASFRDLLPGDFDGDGDDDLLVITHDAEHVELLQSDGSMLTSAGSVATNTALFNTAVGDVDGDDTDEVVFSGVRAGLGVLRLQGGSWLDQLWLEDPDDKLGLMSPNPAPAVSDVNGDGKDDVVRISDGEGPTPRQVMVFVSDGARFAKPAEWGSYTCACDAYFDPVLPYPPG